MKQSKAWVLQAKSDLVAAQAALKESDASTYCQALAKYQQATEKSVKGMVAAVSDLGSDLAITPHYMPIAEIDGLLSLRRAIDNASIRRPARISQETRNILFFVTESGPRPQCRGPSRFKKRNAHRRLHGRFIKRQMILLLQSD